VPFLDWLPDIFASAEYFTDLTAQCAMAKTSWAVAVSHVANE
jgi:hypothetical protein